MLISIWRTVAPLDPLLHHFEREPGELVATFLVDAGAVRRARSSRPRDVDHAGADALHAAVALVDRSRREGYEVIAPVLDPAGWDHGQRALEVDLGSAQTGDFGLPATPEDQQPHNRSEGPIDVGRLAPEASRERSGR
jgi:hypothetical protein